MEGNQVGCFQILEEIHSESLNIKSSKSCEPLPHCLHPTQSLVVCFFPHLETESEIHLGLDGCHDLGCVDREVSGAQRWEASHNSIGNKATQRKLRSYELRCTERHRNWKYLEYTQPRLHTIGQPCSAGKIKQDTT